jgi:hypothetical protein
MPESLILDSNAGCLAVAGPCITAPSLTRNVEPCHGQVTQVAPRTVTSLPWCSGPPRCAQWSGRTCTVSPWRRASRLR